MLITHAFIARTDNIAVLLHDAQSGATAAIDAPDGDAIAAALNAKGWVLTDIFVTHHHGDHTAGIAALTARGGVRVVAPAAEAARIRGTTQAVSEGDALEFAGRRIAVIATPGHTLGHVAYHLPEERLAAVGDTLFALGCGRLLEGTPAQMWDSLQRLMALPDETTLWCGHDYAAANARFAHVIEPGNAAIAEQAARLGGAVATTVAREKAANPFLRVGEPKVQRSLGLDGHPLATIFAEVRRRKDEF